jgi:hypothetical protein
LVNQNDICNDVNEDFMFLWIGGEVVKRWLLFLVCEEKSEEEEGKSSFNNLLEKWVRTFVREKS